MGLGHVTDIKHMVFSRIRFNSGQRVQDWESDMGGNVWALFPNTRGTETACEKKVKAEAGGHCLRPGRAVMGSLASFALVETGKQVITAMIRANANLSENGSC